ncbi:hypothetical protein BV25DRAFT_1816152, partial [Artomyces pyxidatus]
RQPTAIVDRKGRIVVYLAGQPKNDATWKENAKTASRAMVDELRALRFTDKEVDHRRGQYPTLTTGMTYGGGPNAHRAAISRLTSNAAFNRLSGFASSAFNLAAPRLFNHYNEVVTAVSDDMPHLTKAFHNSVFPAATFNLGPQAVTRRHRDEANVPYGWCAVTALGDYDPKTGGHLYLWDLRIVIEFPPGSTILLPSSIILHGHQRPGETRQSFTQYCAGSLVRWYMYGFRTEEAVKAEDPQLFASVKAKAASRWQEVLGYFSKVGKVRCDHGF